MSATLINGIWVLSRISFSFYTVAVKTRIESKILQKIIILLTYVFVVLYFVDLCFLDCECLLCFQSNCCCRYLTDLNDLARQYLVHVLLVQCRIEEKRIFEDGEADRFRQHRWEEFQTHDQHLRKKRINFFVKNGFYSCLFVQTALIKRAKIFYNCFKSKGYFQKLHRHWKALHTFVFVLFF